jgi:phosphoribosylformylglycinamidine synthase
MLARNHDLLSLPLASKGGEGTDAAALRLDALLFGEAQGRVIITVAAINAVKVCAQAKILGITATRIGTVGGGALQIKTPGATVSSDVNELHDLWWNAIARAMR